MVNIQRTIINDHIQFGEIKTMIDVNEHFCFFFCFNYNGLSKMFVQFFFLLSICRAIDSYGYEIVIVNEWHINIS